LLKTHSSASPIATVAVDVPAAPISAPHEEPAETPPLKEMIKPLSQTHFHEKPALQPLAPPESASQQAVQPTAVVPVNPAVPGLEIPDGFHDKQILSQLLQSTGVLTGVVVAIGINEYAHQTEKLGSDQMAELMRSVESMLASLLRPGMDFACR